MRRSVSRCRRWIGKLLRDGSGVLDPFAVVIVVPDAEVEVFMLAIELAVIFIRPHDQRER